jgi:cytoskeletal protein RodZ
MAQSEHNAASGSGGYEKKDVNVKVIILVAVIIIALIVVFIAWIDSLYQVTRDETIQTNVLAPQSDTLMELRAHEAQVLNSYKLLDASTGKYQIPIDRAMQLIAERAYQAKPNK